MRAIKITRALAWAVATDAANTAMRRGGRKVWSIDDYGVAVDTFNWLYHDPRCVWPVV